MPSLESQIKACIDSFVVDLSALVKEAAVESVQQALGSPTTSTRARKTVAQPRTKAKRVSKGRRRSSKDVAATGEAILEFVRNTPGQGAVDIGAFMGLTPKDVRLPIQQLLGQGALRTTGQKRGTKYHIAGGAASKTTPRKKGRPSKKTGGRKAQKRS